MELIHRTNLMNCEKCGSPLKLIPAGVSKKNGKPYSAFYSCPNKCQQPNGQIVPTAISTEKKPNWDEISRGKVRHGVACEFIRLGKRLDLQSIAEMESWVGYIMNGRNENIPF